ncbi:hypothetical protein ACFPWT_12155 [Streptomyces formicae]
MAAGLGPLVVLLGQDRAGQADQGGAVGEDPDHVSPAADLLVQLLLRIVQPDPSRDLAGEGGEGQQVVLGGIEVLGGLRNFASRASGTCRTWERTASVPGCSKTVRSSVAIHGGSACASVPVKASGCLWEQEFTVHRADTHRGKRNEPAEAELLLPSGEQWKVTFRNADPVVSEMESDDRVVGLIWYGQVVEVRDSDGRRQQTSSGPLG